MGADLNNIVKTQRLSDDHVQFLVYQILRGLKVHRHRQTDRDTDSERERYRERDRWTAPVPNEPPPNYNSWPSYLRRPFL